MVDDPLLARARLLVAMSSGGAPDVHSASASFAPHSPASEGASPVTSPPRKGNIPGCNAAATMLKCSVFNGSSLVAVHAPNGGDIRSLVQKGSTIDIDGTEYQISKKQFSEWTPTRFELSIDYGGETNLDACLTIQDHSRRSPKKKHVVEPIPSSDIRNAVQGLESMPAAFQRRQQSDNLIPKPVRRSNNSKNMNITEGKTPMSDFVPDLTAPVHPQRNSIDGQQQPNARLESYVSDEYNAQQASSSMRSDISRINSHPYVHNADEGGPSGYLSQAVQARHVSAEAQRKKATLRVLRKMKDDAEESERKQREEDMMKDAHRKAMEIKAAQLREKTLRRVAKLNTDKVEFEEARRATQSIELSSRLERASRTQTEDYQQRMHKMKKETQKRLQQLRLEEEERRNEEKKVMNKKLSDIADARRRVDREPPRGYVPPTHSIIVRKTRTASPKSNTRSSNTAMEEHHQFTPVSESRDDVNMGNINHQYRMRAPSPVVASSVPLASRSPNKDIKDITKIPYLRSTPPTSNARNGDDDLSDDSLGAPNPAPLPVHFTTNKMPHQMATHNTLEDDISVMTFDSPTRLSGKSRDTPQQIDGRQGSGGNVMAVKKKKTFKALKPLTIQEYAKIPSPEV